MTVKLPIFNFKAGMNTYLQPEVLPDDGFPDLEDAICYRNTIVKRDGFLSLIANNGFLGTLSIMTVTPGNPTIITTTANHKLVTGQQVFIGGVTGTVSIINNNTKDALIPYVITNTGAATFTIPVDTTALAYISGGTVYQPIMGLTNRQLATSPLFPQLIAFNESQAFSYDDSTQTFSNISGSTTWTGTDIDFFWWTNYVGSFWETNFTDPVRYYFGTNWINFNPTFTATCFVAEAHGNIGGAAVTYMFTLSNPPVQPNSVTVHIAAGAVQLAVTLTDNGVGVLISTTAGYSGTIVYSTGVVTLTVLADAMARAVTADYCTSLTSLNTCLLIFPYKDRLVLLNTQENVGGTVVNYAQRARWSQNGTPYVVSDPASLPANTSGDKDAWREDIVGKGGWIDAPTSENIVSAGFVRDTLVVMFDRSAWRLRYTGNEILPFVWERIDSTYGAQGTFSVVPFDTGIMSVGKFGVTMTTVNECERIDYQIPDQIFQISNDNNGQERVYGIRDYQRLLTYWLYPDIEESPMPSESVYYPNKALVYNYFEQNWALFNWQFTVLGSYRRSQSLTWGGATMKWEEADFEWGSGLTSKFNPQVIAGNPLGQVFILQPGITSDAGTGFQWNILTKKFNPFAKDGLQAKAIYMYILTKASTTGQFTINHYIDESPDVITTSYTVDASNSTDQDKVWRRVDLTGTSQYHQFEITFSADQLADPDIPLEDYGIYQIILEVAPSGRLNYGEGTA